VGPRAGVAATEKRKILPLPGIETRILGRPARSLVAVQLGHYGSYINMMMMMMMMIIIIIISSSSSSSSSIIIIMTTTTKRIAVLI
jgi:hypothetical protein